MEEYEERSKPNNDGERELIDRAVKALEAEFATKTCNNKQVISKLVASKDAISRAEVHDLLATWLSDKLDDDTREVLEVIDGKVEDMSPVTPMQRTGHWIFVDKAHEHAHCSECDYGNVDLFDGRPHNYCPSCGAKMVEPQESEEISREEIAALLARESEEQA